MPSLIGKSRKPHNWLPNQVDYGIDCSDPDPDNWKPFGRFYDELQAKQSAKASTASSKPVTTST